MIPSIALKQFSVFFQFTNTSSSVSASHRGVRVEVAGKLKQATQKPSRAASLGRTSAIGDIKVDSNIVVDKTKQKRAASASRLAAGADVPQ